jgi:ribose transport system permease protein
VTRPELGDRALDLVERYALLLAFIAVMVFFSLWGRTSDTFPTTANIKNVLGNQAVVGILAIAIMIPLVSGRFDFSVGPVAGLAQVLVAGLMARSGIPLAVAVLAGIGVGVVVGVLNGTVIAWIGVNSVLVTLGVAAVASGLVTWYTNSQSIITGISKSLVDFGSGQWLGIPRTVYVLAVVAFLAGYLLGWTPYGRYLQAIGSNERAAELVGVPVARFVALSFLISGCLAGLAGVLLVARNGSASPQVGTVGDSVQALAAAFLGATAFRPGRFNVSGTLLAIFFLAFTVTGLSLAGVAGWITDVFDGAALLVAVVISTLVGRRSSAAV